MFATPIVWKLAALKLSDFALIYSILGCCAAFTDGALNQKSRSFYLAGFLAGWGGLMKNEGLLWLVSLLLVTGFVNLIGPSIHDRFAWRKVLMGTLIPVVAIVWFKAALAPPSDLVDPSRCYRISEVVQPGTMIEGTALSVRRDQLLFLPMHFAVQFNLAKVMGEGSDWGIALWWGLFLFFGRLFRHGFRRDAAPLMTAIVMQLASYYAVYLITPYHPYWHLSTSLSRILCHVVPAGFVFADVGFGSIESNVERSSAVMLMAWLF